MKLVLPGHLLSCSLLSLNIGIKHSFSCINIRQVPWEVLKTEAAISTCKSDVRFADKNTKVTAKKMLIAHIYLFV